MLRISLCMIVKNESAVLARCLESAAPWVDEIVVVDTGSTDDTVSIAESFGAVIGHHAWNDDFSAARNTSLDLATGTWILWLDADDVLPKETGRQLRRTAESQAASVGAVFMHYEEVGVRGASRLLRSSLFRKAAGIRFHHRVHEQLRVSGYGSAKSELVVRHYPGIADRTAYDAKQAWYLSIMEREAAEEPPSHSLFYHLGVAHMAAQRNQAAQNAFARLLSLPDVPRERYRIVDALSRLIRLRTLAGDHDGAEAAIHQGTALIPDHPGILYQTGERYLRLGEGRSAYDLFHRFVRLRYAEVPDLVSLNILPYYRYQRLAEAALALGDVQGAHDMFAAILERFPLYPATAEGLSKTSEALGMVEAARALRDTHEKGYAEAVAIGTLPDDVRMIELGSCAPALAPVSLSVRQATGTGT